MTAVAPRGAALIVCEPVPTAVAGLRVVVDDLVDLVFRRKPAAQPRVPGLAARPAALFLGPAATPSL